MSTTVAPLVSVIVPVYNVENYLDACLNSIRQQTYQNLEIIIVEDGSTDNSRQLLDHHLSDKRIKVVQHSKNKGLSAARNTGIESATGEYMMFIDSDDIVDIRLVAACVDCALWSQAEVVTYDFMSFDDGVAEMALPYPRGSLEYNAVEQDNDYYNLPHFAWLKFIRASVIRSTSLRFPEGLYYEDWPFHWHLGLSTTKRFHLPVNFYLYRQRGTSITESRGKELLDLFAIHAIVKNLLDDHKAYKVRKVFAHKCRQSHWRVLTRIDSTYLKTALKAVKQAQRTMQSDDYNSATNIKHMMLSTIVGMPYPMNLYSVKALRHALRRTQRLRVLQK
ncbi:MULTISPECIES: glycosyltransferase family 2 protein [unclassified Psychrobacter]|uniref:glycosyltransferase family 2 protein n=2 Tax=Psychrobacter TaxID=497 RepID=UPI003FD46DC5